MSAVTIDDVFALFKAPDHRSKETERLWKEQSKEADRRAAEFTAQFKKQAREVDERRKETERFLKEQSAETGQKIKEVSEQIGELGNRFGEWVEDFVAPAALRLFTARGIRIKNMVRGFEATWTKEDGSLGGVEVDVMLINGKELVVIECKSRATK